MRWDHSSLTPKVLSAGELFEMIMDEMKFPEIARQAFSLWLVSDNLGKFYQLLPSWCVINEVHVLASSAIYLCLLILADCMVMRHNYGRSLELQLKPNHVPFKLAAFWEELLEKYTVTSPEDMERGQCVSVLVHFMILCTLFYGHYVFSVVLVSVGSIDNYTLCHLLLLFR